MFCKYNYAAGAEINNIKNDIVKILTGETVVNNLSSNCIKSNTLIVKKLDTPADWVIDPSAPANINEYTTSSGVYWKDVTFGLGYFFMCGISSSSAAGNFLQFSADGQSWTALNSLPSALWSKILYNNNNSSPLFVAISGGAVGNSSIAATSNDGKVWTQRALPVAQQWGSLAFRSGASPLWLALPKYVASTVGATSIDGITWTQITLPISMVATGITCDGSNFWVTTYNSTSIYKYNGTTWTAVPTAAGLYFSDIAYGNDALVLTPHEASNESKTLISTNGGLTWVTVTLPAQSYWCRIIFNGTMFFAVGGGNVQQSNCFAFSKNGVDWTLIRFTTTYYWLGLAFGNKTVCVCPGLSVLSPVVSYDSITLKSLNADGSSYKYINLDIKINRLFIRTAELFYDSITFNLCKNSDALTHAQQIDSVNGGVLFIGASNRYFLCLSYKPSANYYGSSSYGSFCGVVEFSKDDLWAGTYPSYAFLSSNDLSLVYVPRTKSSIESDVTGSLAVLALQPTMAMTKQILNTVGSIPQHASTDLRISNTTSYTYTVLGGVILGGIKRTTDSFSITADEVVIDDDTYFVMSGGTTNPALRILMPKF